MSLQNQLIPENKKDDKFCIKTIDDIIKIATAGNDVKAKDILCYKLYYETFTQEDYNYLTQVTESKKNVTYTYPAKMRWIGIVRPSINWVINQKMLQPYNFYAFTIDKESISNKENAKIKEYLDKIRFKIQRKYDKLTEQLMQIQEKEQEFMQMIQKKPESQEELAKLQQLKEVKVKVLNSFSIMKREIQREALFSKEEIDKIEKYYKYDYRDLVEEVTQKGLEVLKRKLDIKLKSKKAFTDKMITGKPLYFVDWEEGNDYATYEALNSVKTYWSNDGDNEWIQDGTWVAILEKQSLSRIIENYDLTTEEIKNIEKRSAYTQLGNNINNYKGNTAVFNKELYSGSSDYDSDGVDVWRVFWKSQRKVKIKEKLHPHLDDTKIIHFENETEENKYDKTNKRNKVSKRYINDIYAGDCIAGCVYKKLGKKQLQLRSIDNLSRVELPVIGKSFSSITEDPYSPILATKDIQILYNIVSYHEELMLALSGTKGFIMDKSQLPEGMSIKEFSYLKKIGVGFIQTVKKGRRTPMFNQFTSYDDTLSPAIQYLGALKESLKATVDDMLGIPRQAKGQFVSKDPVETSKMAQEQSLLIIDHYYQEQDELDKKALTRLMNIQNKIVWKDGEQLAYVGDDFRQEIINIPKGVTDKADVEIFVDKNSEISRKIKKIETMSEMEFSRGRMQIQQLIGIYGTQNIKELERKAIEFSEAAQKFELEKAKGESDGKIKLKETEIKLKAEYDKIIQDQKTQLEMVKNKLEEARLQMDRDKLEFEKALSIKKLDQERALKVVEIVSENETEMRYLDEKKRQSGVDAQIELLQTRIDAILENKSIDKNAEKGTGINISQAPKQRTTKEHIKD